MTKQAKEEVAKVLNEVNKAINISQTWAIVAELAEEYGIKKVSGKYVVDSETDEGLK